MDPERARRVEELFAEHARAVRGYALRRVDSATAEDVVSDVFVVAFRRLETIPEPALPWLLATARKIIANHYRTLSRRQQLNSELRPLQPGVWRDPSTAYPLLDGLARLDERDRDATASSDLPGLRDRE
jgi:DNA-directed RNA polymerase specialized sigma24 family protein